MSIIPEEAQKKNKTNPKSGRTVPKTFKRKIIMISVSQPPISIWSRSVSERKSAVARSSGGGKKITVCV
jgi:hypothetical protein